MLNRRLGHLVRRAVKAGLWVGTGLAAIRGFLGWVGELQTAKDVFDNRGEAIEVIGRIVLSQYLWPAVAVLCLLIYLTTERWHSVVKGWRLLVGNRLAEPAMKIAEMAASEFTKLDATERAELGRLVTARRLPPSPVLAAIEAKTPFAQHTFAGHFEINEQFVPWLEQQLGPATNSHGAYRPFTVKAGKAEWVNRVMMAGDIVAAALKGLDVPKCLIVRDITVTNPNQRPASITLRMRIVTTEGETEGWPLSPSSDKAKDIINTAYLSPLVNPVALDRPGTSVGDVVFGVPWSFGEGAKIKSYELFAVDTLGPTQDPIKVAVRRG